MGERFARAAIEEGGGPAEAELLSRALMWQGHPHEAEDILAHIDTTGLDAPLRLRIGLQRVGNMFWVMNQAERAEEILEKVRAEVDDENLLRIVDGIASACALFENRIATRSHCPTLRWSPRTPAVGGRVGSLRRDVVAGIVRSR